MGKRKGMDLVDGKVIRTLFIIIRIVVELKLPTLYVIFSHRCSRKEAVTGGGSYFFSHFLFIASAESRRTTKS